jgi:TusA-related sulfurtransferase
MTDIVSDIKITNEVDITDVVCPVTFVKAQVALDELDGGEVLSIRLNDGEPIQNVPRTLKEDGHKILKVVDNKDGTFSLLVRKAEEDNG